MSYDRGKDAGRRTQSCINGVLVCIRVKLWDFTVWFERFLSISVLIFYLTWVHCVVLSPSRSQTAIFRSYTCAFSFQGKLLLICSRKAITSYSDSFGNSWWKKWQLQVFISFPWLSYTPCFLDCRGLGVEVASDNFGRCHLMALFEAANTSPLLSPRYVPCTFIL